MEIRELTKNDLPSLLELYIQLSENNKNLTLEKSKEIWIKQIQENPNIKYFGAVENGKVVSTCYCVIIPNLTNFCQPICFVENVVTVYAGEISAFCLANGVILPNSVDRFLKQTLELFILQLLQKFRCRR